MTSTSLHPGSNLTSSVDEAGAEHLLSKLLMGFVERRISPHTIADIVQAQIVEAHLSPETLSPSTCNGILEVITNSATVTCGFHILTFFSSRADFPQFLSQKATFGAIAHLVRLAPQYFECPDNSERKSFTAFLDVICRQGMQFFNAGTLPTTERSRLTNTHKMMPDHVRQWLLMAAPSLEILRAALVAADTPALKSMGPMFAEPLDVIKSILQAQDHFLAQRSVAAFRTFPLEQTESWKMRNIAVLLENLDSPDVSNFKKGFLVEWFVDGLIRDTLRDDNLGTELNQMLKTLIERGSDEEIILKGILRALQRDLCLTATELCYPESKHPQFVKLLQRGENFISLLYPLVQKNSVIFARQFATWALQMPVHPPEARLFTRISWQWLRTLATNQWEDDLRAPPQWVVKQASRFAAPTFRLASNAWLQDYAQIFIERLQLESMQQNFVLSQQHFDYVEFLCRALKKKSPLFASRAELLVALRFLGRTSSHEEGQLNILETRLKIAPATPAAAQDPDSQFWLGIFKSDAPVERFGPNPVARALNMMLYASRAVARIAALKRPQNTTWAG